MIPRTNLPWAAALCGLLGLALGTPSEAITITPSNDVTTLARALVGSASGLTITAASLSFQTGLNGETKAPGALSTGTFTNPDRVYGISSGIVLSTGDVADYGTGPDTRSNTSTPYRNAATAEQEALLDPITGGGHSHLDATQLDLVFDVATGFDTVDFKLVFGTEEWPDYVPDGFLDGFGLYLNGANMAFVDGQPVSAGHPAMGPVPGTELNGLLSPGGNPLLSFSGQVTPGSRGNTLTFLLADVDDAAVDTTVYVASLGGTRTDPDPVPEPSTLLLLGTGLAVLLRRVR